MSRAHRGRGSPPRKMKETHSIAHPELWTLQLAIGDSELQYTLHSESQADSLISGTVAIAAGEDTVKALSDAVYDTPLLLDDYGRVRIVVHSQHFLLLPAVTDDDLARTLLLEQFPDADGDVAQFALPRCGVAMVFEVPRGLTAFLKRTFNAPAIVHHLYPLCEHFKAMNATPGTARMFVNLEARHADLVIFRAGTIVMAGSFPVHNTTDITYMVMNAWQTFGLNSESDELQLIGNRDVRQQVADELRQFVNYVMPAIYPFDALRIGSRAVDAPLDLILFALCE